MPCSPEKGAPILPRPASSSCPRGAPRSCRVARDRHLQPRMTRADSFLATARRVIDVEADALARLSRHSTAPSRRPWSYPGGGRARDRARHGQIGPHRAQDRPPPSHPPERPPIFVHPAEAKPRRSRMMGAATWRWSCPIRARRRSFPIVIAYSQARFGFLSSGLPGAGRAPLLRQSDVAICLPEAPEAWGQGIVPTPPPP